MGIKTDIVVWRKTLIKLEEDDDDVDIIREAIIRHIEDLEMELLNSKECFDSWLTAIANQHETTISELEEKYPIYNYPLFISSCESFPVNLTYAL